MDRDDNDDVHPTDFSRSARKQGAPRFFPRQGKSCRSAPPKGGGPRERRDVLTDTPPQKRKKEKKLAAVGPSSSFQDCASVFTRRINHSLNGGGGGVALLMKCTCVRALLIFTCARSNSAGSPVVVVVEKLNSR